MTPENFAYWLQGFVELHGAPPSAEQWANIKEKLNLSFDRKPLPSTYRQDKDIGIRLLKQ